MAITRAVSLQWTGAGLQFTAQGTDPATPAITIDGDGMNGPAPMQVLLMSAAGCSGADVVHILGKMKEHLQSLSIDVVGVRREEHPRRYTEITLRFRLSGEGLDRPKVERAVDLSLQKYCSVLHSLAGDIAIEREIELA